MTRARTVGVRGRAVALFATVCSWSCATDPAEPSAGFNVRVEVTGAMYFWFESLDPAVLFRYADEDQSVAEFPRNGVPSGRQCSVQPFTQHYVCVSEFYDAGGGGDFELELSQTQNGADVLTAFSGWAGDCLPGSGPWRCRLAFSQQEANAPGGALLEAVAQFGSSSNVPTGANLLVDPGFETSSYRTGTSPVIPSEIGYWKGDQGAFVAGTQSDGVSPGAGTRMLRCDASGPFGGGAGSTGCEAYQVLDVSVYSALIDKDSVQASARVRVNRVAGDAETDREFRLVVYALSGAPSSAPTGLGSALASWTQVIVSDATVASWESLDLVDFALPATTRTLVLRLVAHEDVVDDPGAGEFDGHYFDDASLSLTRR